MGPFDSGDTSERESITDFGEMAAWRNSTSGRDDQQASINGS
jgi:hypothetical protein